MKNDDVVKRLKRARGHLDKVISLIDEGAPCTPTAQQLQAAVRAMDKAKRKYVEDYVEKSLEDKACYSSREVMEDLKEIIKYI